jgi:hypothetical protein
MEAWGEKNTIVFIQNDPKFLPAFMLVLAVTGTFHCRELFGSGKMPQGHICCRRFAVMGYMTLKASFQKQ